ncbi:MAG: hypothetical protein HXY34_00500 [Candidatus Thorarchaeota archaeon]|nr:hypothetical protein [Candidatus Thorarchaeota archaeon]
MTAAESVWSRVYHNQVDALSKISLANLLLRGSDEQIDIVRMPTDSPYMDYELYVKTRVRWKDGTADGDVLPYMPRLLSIVETLRSSRGVPSEIRFDTDEGVAAYIPTQRHISDIPDHPREAAQYLRALVKDIMDDFYETVQDVEDYFWFAARQRGFSPEIVARMARKEPGYYSYDRIQRFERVMQSYFSVKFRVHRSESKLAWEE